MSKLSLWARRLGRGLLVLLLLALLAAAYYAWRASPRHQGLLQAPGLKQEVRVQRDAHGVPTLKAKSITDLAFAVGFSHAQDRGWQLEVQRRIGQGRLAEAFGATALETDRFLRALGVHRVAQAQWAWQEKHGDPEARAALQAYAAGVNAGWRSQARPPEMVVLGLSFEEFTPVDSLAWALMMAWDLGTNWNTELLRLRLALQLPGGERLQRIQDLLPPYPGDRYPETDDYPALYAELGLGAQAQTQLAQVAAATQRFAESGVEGAGSNNWAVAGSRSSTGQPLLANDPHLKLQSPTLWYLARLQAPGLKVAGAMLPGLPFITLGQNEHIAWAFTNTGPDTQDLYLEELRQGAGGPWEARTPDGWAPLSTREEVIRIRGGGEERMQVRASRHGPLISDAGPGRELLEGRDGRRFALALRWAALDVEQDPTATSLRVNRASSVDAFFEAMRGWHSPQQNMLVAERGAEGKPQGEIAYLAPARVPTRSSENRLHGLAPAPGWDARYDWGPYLPFEALPRQRQPTRGWLATANQKIHGADYPHHLSHEWALPHRQQRIEQWLQDRPQHDLDSLAALHADQKSLSVPKLLPLLQKAARAHGQQAFDVLRGFSGDMQADSPAPAIYWAWVRQLTLAVLEDDLGEPLAKQTLGAGRSFQSALEVLLKNEQQPWCDDRRTPAVETCSQQAQLALQRAMDELSQRLGPDPQRWRWGELHQAKGEHRPFSRVPLLRPFFEVKGPVGGDTYTVNVARVRLSADWAGDFYTDDHGPAYRALYDLANPQQSRAIISTGQSGLPWSRHYRDQLQPWLDVKYLPLWQAAAKSELVLMP
ncbi:penicillin acylase family protein [Inhella sp.]|uniref:penicillin acylase family protein n=1 Tax=Inhella sp. TaxID=1921806 RepID=UPI0035B3DB52